ncbi:MAG TPA: CHAT domain-containing protein [Trichocoleus sp.]
MSIAATPFKFLHCITVAALSLPQLRETFRSVSILLVAIGCISSLRVPPVLAQPLSEAHNKSANAGFDALQSGQAEQLLQRGIQQFEAGEFEAALQSGRTALAIYRRIGDRAGTALTLWHLGYACLQLGQYEEALRYSEEGVTLTQGAGKAYFLVRLSTVYSTLGQLQRAIASAQSAVDIAETSTVDELKISALVTLGGAYSGAGQDRQAITLYQQALSRAEAAQALRGQVSAMINMGWSYQSLNEYDQAIAWFERVLPLAQQLGDPLAEAYAIGNLGHSYGFVGRYQEGLNLLNQALPVARKSGDLEGEWRALRSIGRILVQQNQPELAIVYYKAGINVIASLRSTNQALPAEMQQSFVETYASEYRPLVDLLLQQGRILEAQQVLELLKVEELRDFTRSTRTSDIRGGIALNEAEQKILDEHGSLVAFGQEVTACERASCPQLEALLTQRRALTDAYQQRIEALVTTIRDNRARDDFFFDPRYLNESAREIVEAEPGTVLVYPFVQENTLWLLWTAAGEVVGSKQIPLSQAELGATSLRFRELLEDPRSDLGELQAVGKQLYDWLIAPIEQELSATGQPIQHLVFAQDRMLRYVPMAALFDGNQYLVERYRISTILSADLTNMDDRSASETDNTAVLALGLSNSVNGLAPLPNVETEVDAIVRNENDDSNGIYPGLEFLNQDFTLTALERHLRESQIVHIATHGAFVPGQVEQSYLVLGDGQRLTISQIDRLGSDLRDVDLVVLSACQTALGGPGADGIEVAGISSYFLAANRASAVIASLWLVNDASTSVLMQHFYSNLATGMSKAEALRQAQLTMLEVGAEQNGASDRTGTATIAVLPTDAKATVFGTSHPYYWAPFILIGNAS